ncbi:hypothetical protein KLP28_11305 [Nocardioidaceae bacterium]|nr:hypothetical protein KLP28_11305 [Nocardioidaceae bacterium]
MDDIRICGNGHLFAFKTGTCPVCDSIASRPATRSEVDAGEVMEPDPAVRRPQGPVPPPSNGLAAFFVWGIGLIVFAGLVSIGAASEGSAVGIALAYVVGVVGFVIALVGVIAVGVREGITAYAARAGIDPSQLSERVRPPS